MRNRLRSISVLFVKIRGVHLALLLLLAAFCSRFYFSQSSHANNRERQRSVQVLLLPMWLRFVTLDPNSSYVMVPMSELKASSVHLSTSSLFSISHNSQRKSHIFKLPICAFSRTPPVRSFFCEYIIPDSPSLDSKSSALPAPMNFALQFPGLHAATNIGPGRYRPFLDVMFDRTLEYNDIRVSILQGLNTADFDNMRQTCQSLDHCLTESTTTNPPNSRYLPHTIDKCQDRNLPVPPSLPPQGSCPNPPQCTVRIRPCQSRDFTAVWVAHPHGNGERLVCEVCRRNWHYNIGTNPGTNTLFTLTRHVWWRLTIRSGHVTVCKLCDREQKSQHHPEGHDGCVCYREWYKKRWLCRLCDVRNGDNLARDIGGLAGGLNRPNLRQVGNRMVTMRVRPGQATLPPGQFPCPCGRQVSEAEPPAAVIQTPFQGNHNLIRPVRVNPQTHEQLYFTKQCVTCCKYIVPPYRGRPGAGPVRQPTRRSARVADRRSGTQRARRHTMLDRTGKAAARHGVNSKGFEIRRATGGHD